MYEYYVYVVRCRDGSYYTGLTNHVERRVREHNEGRDGSCHTFRRRPVTLVYSAFFENVYEAIDWETTVKGWSRKKKEAMIRDEWERLPELARNRNHTQFLSPKPIRYQRYRVRYRISVMVRQSSP